MSDERKRKLVANAQRTNAKSQLQRDEAERAKLAKSVVLQARSFIEVVQSKVGSEVVLGRKVCCSCKVEMPMVCFHKRSKTNSARSARCRFCAAAAQRKLRRTNAERRQTGSGTSTTQPSQG